MGWIRDPGKTCLDLGQKTVLRIKIFYASWIRLWHHLYKVRIQIWILYHQAKIVRKTLISNFSLGLFTLENDVNVVSKSNKQTNEGCGSGSGIRCLFDSWIQDPE